MEFCGVFYETGYLRAVYDRIRKLFFVFLMAAVLTVGMMGQGMETINFGSVRLKDMAGRAVAEYAAGVGTTGSFMISVTEIQISADVSADLFTVTAIEESAQTGLTVTLDMGNGYSAVYGQLKDVQVKTGDYVAAGSAIGSLNEPTKYYSVEGTNLYFQVLKDGEPVDPMNFME